MNKTIFTALVSATAYAIKLNLDSTDEYQNDITFSGIELAQTQVLSQDSCTYSQDRNKLALKNDFYTLINQDDDELYTDRLFKADSSALYFANGGANELYSAPARQASRVQWIRASANTHMQDTTLFG